MPNSVEQILGYFEQISAIPRCSKDEKRIGRWLAQWATARGLETNADTAGNMVVQVPAAPSEQGRPIVVIQGHMDMVCEKTPQSDHDFAHDPIRCKRQGEWLTADGTTLGADNGIAIAYALALAEDTQIRRPPMELLFTVDEETGLNGVKDLAPGMINGRILINLDSEDEGVFTIGCAGGVDTVATLDHQPELLPKEWIQYQITVGGLRGGHSGIDIHKPRGNANKILARAISAILRHAPCQLASLRGGTRHNAIARDAQAIVACDPSIGPQFMRTIEHVEQSIQKEYRVEEPGLFIKLEVGPHTEAKVLTLADTKRVLRLLLALPHGVANMSPMLKGLVETSSNLAAAEIKSGQLTVLSSQRSSIVSRLSERTAMVHAVAELAGAAVRDLNQYPPWPADVEAPLLKVAMATYQDLFGKAPVIQVIHAGLECAIIGDRYPGMQMLSLGPTIESPHSPHERLFIPSVGKVWQFLVGLLEALGR